MRVNGTWIVNHSLAPHLPSLSTLLEALFQAGVTREAGPSLLQQPVQGYGISPGGAGNQHSHFLHSEFQRFNSWWVCLPPSSHSKDEGSTIREAGWVYWDFICLVLAPSGGPAPEVVSQRFWHLTRRGRCHNLVRCHIPQRSFLVRTESSKTLCKGKDFIQNGDSNKVNHRSIGLPERTREEPFWLRTSKDGLENYPCKGAQI